MEKTCFKSDEKNAKKFLAPFPAFFFFFFEKNWSQNHIYTLEFLKMWYGKTRVTSYELKALKHELNFKSASSNPRVTNSDPRVTRSNPWVTSSSYELRVQIHESLNQWKLK